MSAKITCNLIFESILQIESTICIIYITKKGNQVKSSDLISKIPLLEDIDNAHRLIEKYELHEKSGDNLSDVIQSAEDYFFLSSFVSAQQKAVDIEKFISHRMGGKIVHPGEERGDFSLLNLYCELKTSTTNKRKCLNIRQIRLWQDIDYYICSYIEEKDVSKSKIYLLTKSDMEKEVSLIGSFTHGTVSSNTYNKRNEYSITINVFNDNNIHTKRWNDNYLSDYLFEKIIGDG